MPAGLHHPEENFPEIAFSYLFFTSFAMMAKMRDFAEFSVNLVRFSE
jgi:hypothetical protein